MSVGQALFALISPDLRAGGLAGGAQEGNVAGSAGSTDSFASLLASQNPGELAAKLAALLPEGLTGVGDLSLAEDGKSLPVTLEGWIEDALARQAEGSVVVAADEQTEPTDLTEGAQRWLQWLDSARATLDQPQEPGQAEEEASLALAGTDDNVVAVAAPTAGAMLGTVTPEALKPVPVDPRDALITAIDEAKGKAERKEVPLEASSRDAVRTQGNDQQVQNTPLQRAASVALAAETQAVIAQRMQEPETLLSKRGTDESDALDGLTRPGSTQTSPGQIALTARPVTALPQALGVPFGQPSWGEAMVEKVMWMSSQNLRSVEIRLDPAELGPLEIHIQNRGQENQVQFLSQNASVREALESQMFRLREMFSQQGMERVDVTVADSSQRDASGGQARGGFGEQRGDTSGGAGQSSGEAGQPILTTSAAAQVSSDRLVDYYA